ncbi:hypothetical protein [Streptomyces sp. NPDC008092]|uniref:hypothetical protein n=1 Tax=Streptomyces sp. NPDC008092 TaxID=3364808 RepID=UPI0036EFF039
MTHTTHVRRTAVVAGAARGTGAAVTRRPAGDGPASGVVDPDEADRVATAEAPTNAGREDRAGAKAGFVPGSVSGRVSCVAVGPVNRE